MTITFKKEICTDLADALSREWLDTNAKGGYASSSIANCNTRKYHGLLVTKLFKPAGKYVLLSKYDESIVSRNSETEHFFSTSQYRGAISPEGYKNAISFTQEQTPTFKYLASKVNLTKKIAMVQGQETTLVSYECSKNPDNAILRIKPLMAYRNFHDLAGENVNLQVRTFPAKNGFKIQPYEDLPPLYIQTNGKFEFFPAPNWYRDVEYQREWERGFACTEDLFCPGMFEIEFPKDTKIILSASTTELQNLEELWQEEIKNRTDLCKTFKGTPLQKNLKWSAHQFISQREEGKAITAGFPWFLEWGRDAMISLPGLLLHSKMKNQDYIDILKGFAVNAKQGLVPNFLGESANNNAYNSADASLWYAYAIQKYIQQTNDQESLKGPILHTLESILQNYQKGTLYNIKMLENGLITAGSFDSQITWMDANSNDKPVTPRNGCPVEINALWYNLVCFLRDLFSCESSPLTRELNQLSELIQKSFVKEFWLEDKGYLADLICQGKKDEAIRPNQIFAVSLDYSPLSKKQAQSVLDVVTSHLYTPLGLRTLSPEDKRYIGKYSGGPEQRDSAYHNGTIWPWLLGHYVDALVKTNGLEKSTDTINEILHAMEDHLQKDGVGSISEIFDGYNPLKGHGCPSQAWSVAEILRIAQKLEKNKMRRKEQ